MIRKIKIPILKDNGINLIGQLVLINSENQITFKKSYLSNLDILEDDSDFFVIFNNKKLAKITLDPMGQNLNEVDFYIIKFVEEIKE